MGRLRSQRGPGEKGWSATRDGCDVIVEEEFDAYGGHGAGFTKVETGATGKGVGDTVGSCWIRTTRVSYKKNMIEKRKWESGRRGIWGLELPSPN